MSWHESTYYITTFYGFVARGFICLRKCKIPQGSDILCNCKESTTCGCWIGTRVIITFIQILMFFSFNWAQTCFFIIILIGFHGPKFILFHQTGQTLSCDILLDHYSQSGENLGPDIQGLVLSWLEFFYHGRQWSLIMV